MADSLFESIIEIVEGMDEVHTAFLAGNFEANLRASKIHEDQFPIAVINNSFEVNNTITETSLITRSFPITIAFLMLDEDLDATALQTQQEILNPMQAVADKFIGLLLNSDLLDPSQDIDSYTTQSQVKIYDDILSGVAVILTVPEKTGKSICKTDNVI